MFKIFWDWISLGILNFKNGIPILKLLLEIVRSGLCVDLVLSDDTYARKKIWSHDIQFQTLYCRMQMNITSFPFTLLRVVFPNLNLNVSECRVKFCWRSTCELIQIYFHSIFNIYCSGQCLFTYSVCTSLS